MTDSYLSIAMHNQFLQEVDRRNDRETDQWIAAGEAVEMGHKPSCKWVEILRNRQAMAHESWCDCGEWERSGREAKWKGR